MDPFFIKVTHTGVFPDGRPNRGSIFISDLDTGLENQNRKTPVYVPFGGSINIPLASRSMLSMQTGCISKFVLQGLITVQVLAVDPIPKVSNAITWGPNGDVQHWEDVVDFINASTSPVDIYALTEGTPLQITNTGSPVEMHNSRFIGNNYGDFFFNILEIQDGVLLRNMGGSEGALVLRSLSSSKVFENDPHGGGPAIYFMNFNAVYQNMGTAPMIEIPDNEFVVFGLRGGGVTSGTPGQPIVNLGNSSLCLVGLREGIQTLYDEFISGPASSMAGISHDGTIPFPIPTFPLFAGTVLNLPVGVVGGSGPTSFRPTTGFSSLSEGCTYYDTDITTPIWWDGSVWLDASGTPV